MNIEQVPTSDELRPAVLKVLSDGQARSRKDIHELVANLMRLSAEVQAQKTGSGQGRLASNMSWALSALSFAGLLERPKKGWYKITDSGLEVNARNLLSYSEKELIEWPAWQSYKKEIAERKAARATISDTEKDDENTDSALTTYEAVFEGVEELNANTETELRQRLQASTPEFFEKAVIELLWAMGYGGAHGEKSHLGQSNDRGIDGSISQDALGLEKVYIQAKRYADDNTVGSGEIRDFIGAINISGSNKGVFITTSRFTPGALSAAEKCTGTIVLIDGVKLTSLMLKYKVAVQKVKNFELFQVDDDFFEEDFA